MDADTQAILDEFFAAPAVVRYRHRLEGMRVEEGLPVFGDRAGPSVEASNLLHEMAHFVEIDEARMAVDGFGFIHGSRTIYVPGRYSRIIHEHDTYQATMREIRTMAFQWNLLVHFDIERSAADLICALRFMPDFWHVPRTNKGNELGHEWESSYSYDGKSLDWCLNKMLELSRKKAYSVEAFRTEWNRRNDILRSRIANMEVA